MNRMKAIRDRYRVPAKRGMRILFRGEAHIITGTTAGPQHLRVRPAMGFKSFPIHPTWSVVYPTPEHKRTDARP